MIRVPLNTGGFTIVDDDFPNYAPIKGWTADSRGYVLRHFWKLNKVKVVLIHRLIMNAPSDKEVDHIDGDRANNLRSNLRLCTHHENQRNRKKLNKNNSSGVKGVYLDRRTGTYYAQVSINSKAYNVGSRFKTIEEAADCRDAAAKKMHGDFYAPCRI